MYLCCDLGGTNARFAVFDPTGQTIVYRASSKVRDHPGFDELLASTLEGYRSACRTHRPITNTVLGVAGATNGSQVQPTNIAGWFISVDKVGHVLRQLGHQPSVSILNDFEALGLGVLHSLANGFNHEDYVQVCGQFDPGSFQRDGQTGNGGTRSLICGPGTGLGMSCVVEGLSRDGMPFVLSSEAGHHCLAPESADEYRFLGHDGRFTGRRSYEAALSGAGLRNIYNFYRQSDYGLQSIADIRPEQIVSAASSGDAAAAASLEFFSRILAQFCGNMVLTFNCDRSVFLWGGTLRGIPFDVLTAGFEQRFSERCAHADRVAAVSVVLLQNDEIPLHGCALRASYDAGNRTA